jgi:prepilin-type N-terminal cleavage/methylation domain-containing protein
MMSVKRRGFTLIELLVVMTIAAIGFFALRPSFGGMLRGAQQRKAAGQLVGLLIGARTRAVAGGVLVRVMCDAEQGVLWAESQVDPAADRSQFELLRIQGRKQITLPEWLMLSDVISAGESVSSSLQSAVYFYPDGTADGATLVLADAAGREIVVELAAATGRVYVGD